MCTLKVNVVLGTKASCVLDIMDLLQVISNLRDFHAKCDANCLHRLAIVSLRSDWQQMLCVQTWGMAFYPLENLAKKLNKIQEC